jgi:hypothetical protein
LHFGLINNGKYINPNQLRMVGAEKLNDKQMKEFAQQKEKIKLRMERKLNPPEEQVLAAKS